MLESTNFYEVKADVFIKRVEDEFRQSVVAPRSVDQEESVQVTKLKKNC